MFEIVALYIVTRCLVMSRPYWSVVSVVFCLLLIATLDKTRRITRKTSHCNRTKTRKCDNWRCIAT